MTKLETPLQVKYELLGLVESWSYDRGHSAGQEEVQSLKDGYLDDLKDIIDYLTDPEITELW